MEYKYLIFDIDNTLTNDFLSRKYGYIAVCNELGIDYLEENLLKFIAFDDNFWKEWDNGKIVVPHGYDLNEWLRAQRFINNFQNIDFALAVRLNEIYINNFTAGEIMMKDADKLIEYLYNKYELIIATNGPSSAAKLKLENIGLLQYFDHVFIAEDVGYGKPNKEFFEHIMNTIGCHDTKKIAMIGDSIHTDVKGGINIGIDTYWLNHENKDSEGIIPTHEFKELKQLFELL